MAFPGDRSILRAASESGKRGASVMAGVTIMMVIAGLLEAFPRQLVGGAENRFLIGGTMLALWVVYFFAYHPIQQDDKS